MSVMGEAWGTQHPITVTVPNDLLWDALAEALAAKNAALLVDNQAANAALDEGAEPIPFVPMDEAGYLQWLVTEVLLDYARQYQVGVAPSGAALMAIQADETYGPLFADWIASGDRTDEERALASRAATWQFANPVTQAGAVAIGMPLPYLYQLFVAAGRPL